MQNKDDSLQYHIQCASGDVGKYCILTGDPGRCQNIAKYLDSSKLIAQNREYVTYTGSLDGTLVSVTSTGIGGPSAAIAMEELVSIGTHTFIRVGTCGGISKAVNAGDIVIATGAIRAEGTSREYAPIEFPAVADYEICSALVSAAHEASLNFHVGVVQCKDSFYGQHSPERMPIANELINKWEAWKRLGTLASEMESAALFTVAAALGVRCGSCFNVLWNQELGSQKLEKKETNNMDAAVNLAVSAIRKLIQSNERGA